MTAAWVGIKRAGDQGEGHSYKRPALASVGDDCGSQICGKVAGASAPAAAGAPAATPLRALALQRAGSGASSATCGFFPESTSPDLGISSSSVDWRGQPAAATADCATSRAAHEPAAASPPPRDEQQPAEAPGDAAAARAAQLVAANAAMAAARLPGLCLPGGPRFTPVSPACCLLPLCGVMNIPEIAVCLGASYFQRLLARNPSMHELAVASGWFSLLPDHTLVMHSAAGPGSAGLLCTYATCIYIATKLADTVEYQQQLTAMLEQIMGSAVAPGQASQLELMVCDRLQWRLGPYDCLADAARA
eukprot:scaffold2.g7212.t1